MTNFGLKYELEDTISNLPNNQWQEFTQEIIVYISLNASRHGTLNSFSIFRPNFNKMIRFIE